ncbi:MAG TPA: hypothetical protein VFO10_19295 [Oligoflexus sp.]|uniref:hypothetical protein n=1 Tax=Oligoflexus sp. TaxID=1971216 RepID=UPI002D7EC8E1|nr:hypothetical protein [Oligoflexus sp.]HET9239416.1 hypothetical protein [Oligoflexus sp.]
MDKVPKLLVMIDGKEGEGPASITYVSLAGALWRGTKTFLLAFFGGLIVFPVPLLHIFGVLLLLASPFAGVMVVIKSYGLVQGMAGEFNCPHCAAANAMEYQEGNAPFYGSCSHCRNPYQVFPKA